MSRKMWISASVLASGMLAAPVSADTGDLTTTVTKLLVDDTKFGECMAFLGNAVGDSGANCNGSWVTLGCDGRFGSKSNAGQRLSALQLAYVTGKSVRVWVDDSKKVNGSCYAFRVDNL